MTDQNAITPDGQVKRDQESTRDSTRNKPQSQYTTAASLALNYINGDAAKKATIEKSLESFDEDFQAVFLQYANNPMTIPRGATKVSTWTVNDLLDADFPEPIWLVPDMIPTGLVSLAGKPKVGKSWLALQLAIAAASGGYFLGTKMQQSPVLYLAFEDSGRRLKTRVEALGVKRNTPITFHTDYRLMNAGGLDDLYREIQDLSSKLNILDTFGRSVGRHEIKDYSENVNLLSPLQSMAQELGVTILLVDHHGKLAGGDNPIVDLIGSIGKAATFDAVMGLYKQQGVAGGKLMVVSRDSENIDMAVEWDPVTCSWQALGDVKSYYQQNVLEAIAAMHKNGLLATTTNIAEYMDSDKAQVFRAISNLINVNKVRKLAKIGVEQPFEVIP